jgi:hypothetical protein
VTGQSILKAILDGERDPQELAAYRDGRIQASEEEIAQAREGNWQEDQLFLLRQEQAGYEFCQKQIMECDQQLAHYLAQLEDRTQGATLPEACKGRRKKNKDHPQFNLREELFRMTGTDLTQIHSIDVRTAMTVISEVGPDMSKWKTENHFVSWLKLAPNNKISGGKIIGKARTPTNNRAATALRMAASTLRESDSYLGAQFRRLRTRLGPPVATKAMAAKLARLVYRMLRYGMKYTDQGAKLYDAQYRKQQVTHLKRKAAKLGLQVIEAVAA